MKLSIEAKVAAAVAAAFAALTVGTIAQGNSSNQAGGANNYDPTHNLGVSDYMAQEGFNSSLSERANAEENRHRPSWQHESLNVEGGKTTKTLKPRKHRAQHVDQNQRTEITESEG